MYWACCTAHLVIARISNMKPPSAPSSRLASLLARRVIVWPLLAMPAAFVLMGRYLDTISYGQAILTSGHWSIGFLCAALLATPLKRLLPRVKATQLLLSHRRAIGVASFAFAFIHTAIYLDKKWPAGLVLKEGQDPSLLTGWIAFLLFLPLAVTSNNISVRKLGRSWKTLHRIVYLAAGLGFAHWALTSLKPATALYISIAICLFELSRIRGKL